MSAYILDFAGKPVGTADIDDKIQSLHDDIAFLQRLRNSRLIVGRIIATLPDDILIMIFQSVHGLLSAGDRAESPVKVCLGLTHVCQRWRNILLSTAQFWSTVYTSIPAELIPLWLSRSGDLLPLHLTSARRRVEVKDTVNLVLTQQAHRLKTIQLMPRGDITTLYKDALEQIQEAPLLETLALTTRVKCTTEHIKFSPTVQDDLAPRLHSLALINCIMDLNVQFFSRLRTLNIQFQPQFRVYGNLQNLA
ncbi:hypothetical protein ONZ45_g13642 [Pleurotus djamor]|nr:hypothetical protein ONZ45_g13642 [Pleurotus djamor]